VIPFRWGLVALAGVVLWAQGNEAARKAKLQRVEALIAQHPDSVLFTKDETRITPDDFGGALAGERDTIIKAWRAQIQAHPDEERVLENALRSLNQIDYQTSVESLKGLRRVEPTNPRWAFLLAAIYEGAVTKKELAPEAEADLAASNDLAVLGLTGQDLYLMGKSNKADDLASYGESLLKKAQALDPLNPRWRPENAGKMLVATEQDLWPYGKVPPMPVPEGAVRVAGVAWTHREEPVCIAVPRAPCPTGRTVVTLDVVIGKDGRVKTLHASSGSVSLIPQAMDAVRQWTSQPRLVNGQAVEVVTQVGAVFGDGGAFTPPVAISQPEAVYTPEARAAGFSGSVLVSCVVDENGMPQRVTVTRGVGLGLDERAVEAVKQWRFKPATRDGKPVAVPAQVEVRFKSR
jgi:TonB family protein